MAKRGGRSPTKRAPDPEALEARAIEAALDEAERVGWEALRLARVAERIGVTLAALHARFASADRLADAWLDRAERAMVAAAEEIAGLPAAERVARAILAWLDVLAPHRRVARQILFGRLHPGHPHLVAGAVVRLSRTVQLVREVAALHAPPPRRQLEEIALTALFVAALARWSVDASTGQEATRAWLRRHLRRAAATSMSCAPAGPGAGRRESAMRPG